MILRNAIYINSKLPTTMSFLNCLVLNLVTLSRTHSASRMFVSNNIALFIFLIVYVVEIDLIYILNKQSIYLS